MRDYDDDEMMYDDDEDNSEHPFAFAQGGIMGIPLSDFIKNLKKSESAGLSASMFDNEWLLQFSSDVIENNNEIAITNSPLYRFYQSTKDKTFSEYKMFCSENGFRCMNVINFEVKSKFIKEFIKRKNF